MATKKKPARRRAKKMTAGSVDARGFLESLHGRLTFGRALASIRKSDALSLAEFAAKLGITRTRLSDIEHGRQGVSASSAAQWGEILGYGAPVFVKLALQDQLDAAGIDLRVDVRAA